MHKPADVLFAHACQLERELMALVKAAESFRDGFTYDPGHSDLDNEQPIHVRVTLGAWRRLNGLLRVTDTAKKPVHYWTGRGTLCSLDNNVRQQPNHSSDKASVDCPYCLYQIELNRRAA